MKIILIVILSVLAVILTVLGIVWSNKRGPRMDPDDQDALMFEIHSSAWHEHRGTAFGIGGAALGFAATVFALFAV